MVTEHLVTLGGLFQLPGPYNAPVQGPAASLLSTILLQVHRKRVYSYYLDYLDYLHYLHYLYYLDYTLFPSRGSSNLPSPIVNASNG